MVDPIDNIAQQARQGSVAAIIQVLNEKLAGSGVRTRAFFEDGVLQLLCEAAQANHLDQSVLVPEVQRILESISPRNIRRVNINSRIVNEQQLLWMKEIQRNPENQLWSQEIILARRNLLKQLVEDFQLRKTEANEANLSRSTSPRKTRDQQQFRLGILGGASLSIFLLIAAVGLYGWLNPKWTSWILTSTTQSPSPTVVPPSPLATINPSPSMPVPSASSATSQDPFVEAVRLAEQSSIAGQKAQSSADWLALATKWQQASDLMAKVPPQDQRYKTAQGRTALYLKFSNSALAQASRKRSQPQ